MKEQNCTYEVSVPLCLSGIYTFDTELYGYSRTPKLVFTWAKRKCQFYETGIQLFHFMILIARFSFHGVLTHYRFMKYVKVKL